MKRVLLFSIFVAALAPLTAWAGPIKFSIDPASPSIDGNITPDDVLIPGPQVHTHGANLGLMDGFLDGFFDNLNALSYGQDPISKLLPLFFSVDRIAVGAPGSDVNAEARPGVESAHGDVYTTFPLGSNLGTNRLLIQEVQLGLRSGFFGDDLNGLDLDAEPKPFTYFSIDSLSVSNGNACGKGGDAADILVSKEDGTCKIYAEGELAIGLLRGDDIDALVLLDRLFNDTADSGIDQALFSLSPFSPSTFTFTGNPYVPCVRGFMSPADVCFTTFDGHYTLWAGATEIGLRPDDNVDALDTIDATNVPEPPTFLLFIGGALALATRRALRSAQPAGVRTWMRFCARPRSHCRKTRGAFIRYEFPAAPHAAWAMLVFMSISLVAGRAYGDDRIGQGFFGTSPPVAKSQGALFLGDDVVNQKFFRWQSEDSILDNVDTGGFVPASVWNYYPAFGPPARLIFVGSGDGATLYGDVLFEPYNRAVIDVVKGGRRVRYLLKLNCAAPTLPAPAKFVVSGYWDVEFKVSADDGLVVSNASLARESMAPDDALVNRYMATQISVPYYTLKTEHYSDQFAELTPDSSLAFSRSRLVDFHKRFDADSQMVEATYAVDRIPPTSASCLLITQRYEFRRRIVGDHCEPSGRTPCARYYPTVAYKFFGRQDTLVAITIPQRFDFQPDRLSPEAAAIFRDEQVGPIPLPVDPLNGQNPLQRETGAFAILNGKGFEELPTLNLWDNYHQTWDDQVDEPRLRPDFLGGRPGCPECIHIHWRWGSITKLPGFNDDNGGKPRIPADSNQDVFVGVAKSGAPTFDWQADLNGQCLTGTEPSCQGKPSADLVFWYEGTGKQVSDTFFMHGAFYVPYARDVTDQVFIQKSQPRLTGDGLMWIQDVTLTNISNSTLDDAISLVLDGLGSSASFVGSSNLDDLGETSDLSDIHKSVPNKLPYVLLNANGLGKRGDFKQFRFLFANTNNQPPAYKLRVQSGGVPYTPAPLHE